MTLRDKALVMMLMIFLILQFIYANSIQMQAAQAVVPIAAFFIFYIGISVVICFVGAFVDEDIHKKSKHGYAVMAFLSGIVLFVMYDVSMIFFCLDLIAALLYFLCYIIVREKRNDEIL